MGTSSSSSAHLPLHGHILSFMGTSSPSWAHLSFHGDIFAFMDTSFPSWAHLTFHGHISPFMGTSFPSWARLLLHFVFITHLQQIFTVLGKLNVKPNRRQKRSLIWWQCAFASPSWPTPCPEDFQIIFCIFQSTPAKSLDYPRALKKHLDKKRRIHAANIWESIWLAATAGRMALMNGWQNISRFSITKLHKIQIRGFMWKAKPEHPKRNLTRYSILGSFNFANSSFGKYHIYHVYIYISFICTRYTYIIQVLRFAVYLCHWFWCDLTIFDRWVGISS